MTLPVSEEIRKAALAHAAQVWVAINSPIATNAGLFQQGPRTGDAARQIIAIARDFERFILGDQAARSEDRAERTDASIS